jgi:L(+)-tartrate dehydratase beta subunit
VTPEAIAGLELGQVVALDGVVYTAREGVYRRLLEDGVAPPVELAALSNVNFHCSPAASVGAEGSYKVGAVTATASFRFSKWMDRWFEASGARVILGKGGMSEAEYRETFVPRGAVYLTTVGYGTGALLGRGIERVREVHWLEELGIAQALWVFEVANFGPFLVESDAQGNSLFERHNREMAARLDALYENLKPPALHRYGETDDRKDELI